MKKEEAVKRLALIKYLYNVGIEQSRKAEPLCWTSVLTFHDAIELFLELASEYLDVGKRLKDIKFMEYWSLINPILKNRGKEELTQKISIDRLNGARVAFKHHGTPPSKSAIEGFRTSATSFFEENAPTVFDVRFPEISLISLVQYEDTRRRLFQAQKLLREGKIDDVLVKIAISFVQLIDDYEDKKRDEFGRSPFFLGSVFSAMITSEDDEIEELGLCLDDIVDSIDSLQDAVKILSLCLDYRRYAKFKLLTPAVVRRRSEEKKKFYVTRENRRGSKGKPSLEDVQFCIDFVIESAIVLQEFDFEIERVPTTDLPYTQERLGKTPKTS